MLYDRVKRGLNWIPQDVWYCIAYYPDTVFDLKQIIFLVKWRVLRPIWRDKLATAAFPMAPVKCKFNFKFLFDQLDKDTSLATKQSTHIWMKRGKILKKTHINIWSTSNIFPPIHPCIPFLALYFIPLHYHINSIYIYRQYTHIFNIFL